MPQRQALHGGRRGRGQARVTARAVQHAGPQAERGNSRLLAVDSRDMFAGQLPGAIQIHRVGLGKHRHDPGRVRGSRAVNRDRTGEDISLHRQTAGLHRLDDIQRAGEIDLQAEMPVSVAVRRLQRGQMDDARDLMFREDLLDRLLVGYVCLDQREPLAIDVVKHALRAFVAHAAAAHDDRSLGISQQPLGGFCADTTIAARHKDRLPIHIKVTGGCCWDGTRSHRADGCRGWGLVSGWGKPSTITWSGLRPQLRRRIGANAICMSTLFSPSRFGA